MEFISSLRGQFIVAMPNLKDPTFSKAVIYLCEHTEEGAMGLVINQPLDLSLYEMLKNITTEPVLTLQDAPVYHGGPVQPDRGFVLHTSLGQWNASIQLDEKLSLTTSRDVLEAIAAGTGPEHYLITLGYAGWGAHQLEKEIADNAWLCVPASHMLLFELPWNTRWRTAASLIGVEMDLLSTEVGHA